MTKHLRTLCYRIRKAKRGKMSVSYALDAAGNVESAILKGNGYRTLGDRHALGYVQSDVTKARAILRKRGWRGTVSEAEGILAEALVRFDAGWPDAGAAARKARQRARATGAGLCGVCATEPAREGRKTCALCNARAAERTARRRIAQKEAAYELVA